MWDQVLHPYKTRGKIVVLYIWIFIFLDQEKKAFEKYMCSKLQYSPPNGNWITTDSTTPPLPPLRSIQYKWQTTITTTLICEWKFVRKKNTWHKNWSRSSFNLTSPFCCILRASGSTFLFCSTNFAVICCFNKHICFYQSPTLLCFYHPHTTSRITRSLQKLTIRTRKEVERTGSS